MGPPILCAEIATRSAPIVLDIQGHFAKRLDRIDMQQATRVVGDVGRLADRLDDPGLVVGGHQRHQWRLPPWPIGGLEPLAQMAERGNPVASASNVIDRGEVAAGLDRDVFQVRRRWPHRNNPDALIGQVPAQRQRVGLRPAGGENHVARLGSDRCGDPFPRILDEVPDRAPLGMHGRRVPDHVHGRGHGGARLRAQRRRRIPVEIDPFRHDPLTCSLACAVAAIHARPLQRLLKCLLFVPALVLKAPAAIAWQGPARSGWCPLPKTRMVLNTYACRPVPSSAP